MQLNLLNKVILENFPCFELCEDQAILSVWLNEMGISKQLAPMEKRSINLTISCLSETKFDVKIILRVTSIQFKFLILSIEITENYHFVATPRSWL